MTWGERVVESSWETASRVESCEWRVPSVEWLLRAAWCDASVPKCRRASVEMKDSRMRVMKRLQP